MTISAKKPATMKNVGIRQMWRNSAKAIRRGDGASLPMSHGSPENASAEW